MAFSYFEFLIIPMISFLSVQVNGNYYPYGGRFTLSPFLIVFPVAKETFLITLY